MANPYPATVSDDNNRLRVDGSVTFTDPANQPGGGSSAILTATKHVTSAQIKNLAASPVTLIAAPALGAAVLPLAVFVHLNFLTAAYVVDSGSTAELCLGANGDLLDVGINSVVTASQAAGSWVGMPAPAPGAGSGATAAFDTGYLAQPFVLANFGGGDFITGGGSLDFTIYYVSVTGVA